MLFARQSLFLSVSLGLLSACSTVPKETPKGKAIQIIKSPFAETCVQLGKIRYDGTPFIHDKELLIILKENAAKLGGNAVRLDTFTPGITGVSNAKGLATSYKCNVEKLRAYLLNPSAAVAPSEDEEGDEAAASETTPDQATSPRNKGKGKSKKSKTPPQTKASK